MSDSLERARLLLEQSRPSDAETYAREAIAEDTENAEAYVLLSYALAEQGNHKDAIEAAQKAVGIDPENHYTHFTLGRAYYLNSNYKRAKTHLDQARDIYPEDSDTWGMLSALSMQEAKWEEALERAEQGLKYDSENSICINYRAAALTKLKRSGEAFDTLDVALHRNPEDPYAHFQKGYTLLENGKHEEAATHFCEALRLQPDFEEAREGLIEALKARYVIYSLFLKYVFFMSRLPQSTQFGIFIGGYFIQRILSNMLSGAGAIGWSYAVTGIWLAAILTTWTASSLFNLLLFLHPLGKHALTPKQKRISVAVGSCLAVTLFCIVGGLTLSNTALAIPNTPEA